MDHAARTALLCRSLHDLLVRHSVIAPFSSRDPAALMVAAMFHDAARRLDTGPDDSVPESAALVSSLLEELGYTAQESRLGGDRVRGSGTRGAEVEVGAAILQSADALELMRNYVGDVRLAATPLYRLLRDDPAAAESYARLARGYGRWLQSIAAWGLGAGRVLGPDGRVELVSPGPLFDPVGVFRRSLSTRPVSEIRTLLDRALDPMPAPAATA
jgi:hypothetical protein